MAPRPTPAPARPRSPDRPAISARRLVRSRRAAVPCRPARHGERPDILHYLAVCLSQRGALADAEALWRKAIAKDPNEPMLSYNLGLVARRLGQLDEAAQRFRDTIRRAPTHIEARLALASIHIDRTASPPPSASCPRWSPISTARIQQPDGRAAAAAAGARPQHAGLRALPPRPLRPAIEILDLALRRCRRGRRAARARSWATARWRWAASAITTRRSPKPSRRSTLAPESASLNHVLGFVLYFAGRRVGRDRADPEGARDRSGLRAGAQDAGAGPGRRRQRSTTPIDAAAARPAPESARSRRRPAAFLPLYRAQNASSRRSKRWSPISSRCPTTCGALNNQGLALARPEALRRGAPGAEARLAACDRRSAGADQPRRACWSISAGPAEARSLHEHALRGLPGDSRLLTNYGICLVALGERDRARETLDEALAANPNNNDALAARAGLDA